MIETLSLQRVSRHHRLFVPFPFVVAILLSVLLVLGVRNDEGVVNGPFLALILVSAILPLLTGLRWGYEVEGVKYIAPVVAATVPPLAHAGVSRLVHKSSLSLGVSVGLHAIPALIIVLLELVWREMIDVALVLIFVGYAVAILLMMRRGADYPFNSGGSFKPQPHARGDTRRRSEF